MRNLLIAALLVGVAGAQEGSGTFATTIVGCPADAYRIPHDDGQVTCLLIMPNGSSMEIPLGGIGATTIKPDAPKVEPKPEAQERQFISVPSELPPVGSYCFVLDKHHIDCPEPKTSTESRITVNQWCVNKICGPNGYCPCQYPGEPHTFDGKSGMVPGPSTESNSWSQICHGECMTGGGSGGPISWKGPTLSSLEPKPEAMDVKPVPVKSDEHYAICIDNSYTNQIVRYSDGGSTTYFGSVPPSLEALRECRGKADWNGISKFACADPRRVMLTSQDGKPHCILFPPQEAK